MITLFIVLTFLAFLCILGMVVGIVLELIGKN